MNNVQCIKAKKKMKEFYKQQDEYNRYFIRGRQTIFMAFPVIVSYLFYI